MPPKKKPVKQDNPEVRIVFNEAGTSGLKEMGGVFAEAYLPTLQYPGAYQFYEKLRRSMPEIVIVRRTFEAWARSIKPTIDLPDDPTDDDKRYQEFIEQDFENMEGGFSAFLETAVSHNPFMGLAWFDVAPSIRDPLWIPPPYTDRNGKTWQDDWRSEYDDGLIGIRRIGFRSMQAFTGWELDGRKKAIGMKQQDYPNPPVTLWKNHSLHLTFGDNNNPEGLTPLEAAYRVERFKYALEVIMGIGYEHAAGYLKVWKTEKGDISAANRTAAKEAARAILSASEGNYAIYPFGFDGEVKDVGFQAAGNLLNTIQYFGILTLSLYMMQFVALNTMTNTGALASQVDSTQTAITAYNSMIDGIASQYDQQVGRRLWGWNKSSFPNATKRPQIKFSHLEPNAPMGELGSLLSQVWDLIPLGEDDIKAFRKRTGWMPQNPPKEGDEINEPGKKVVPPQFNNQPGNQPMPDDETVRQAVETKQTIEQALRFHSRSTRGVK